MAVLPPPSKWRQFGLNLFAPQKWYDKNILAQRYIRALVYLLNIHTLVLCITGCLAVYLCDMMDFRYNMVRSLASCLHVVIEHA